VVVVVVVTPAWKTVVVVVLTDMTNDVGGTLVLLESLAEVLMLLLFCVDFCEVLVIFEADEVLVTEALLLLTDEALLLLTDEALLEEVTLLLMVELDAKA